MTTTCAAFPIEKATRLYEGGLSLADVGKECGCCTETVRKHLMAAGIERRHGRQPIKVDEEEAVRMYLAGARAPKISAKMGISDKVIYRILRLHDVKIKPIEKSIILPMNEVESLYAWGMTCDEIGEEYGCCGGTVLNRMTEADIPRRNQGYTELDVDEDKIVEMYLDGVGINRIGKVLEVSGYPVARILRKHGVTIKKFPTPNFVTLSKTAIEFLSGEIIGDGCLHRSKGSIGVVYGHTSKHRSYLEWLSGVLSSFGIAQGGNITRQVHPKMNDAVTYHYSSLTYRKDLLQLWKRWYPNGKKHVPEDLVLTPLMVRQWICGDGSLTREKGMILCTYGFAVPEVELLRDKLIALGFKTVRWAGSNVLYIWKKSVPALLEWMGPSPISCFDYKWDLGGCH